jgi:hypothetical protein
MERCHVFYLGGEIGKSTQLASQNQIEFLKKRKKKKQSDVLGWIKQFEVATIKSC